LLREGLGENHAVLIVEGASDRNFYRRIVLTPAQIVVSEGKSLLLDAYRAMKRSDRGKVLFVTDCDGDVPAGRMQPAPDLIVSQFNDVEADLIHSGILTAILPELITGADDLDEGPLAILAEEIRSQAAALAMPIGRIRRAARVEGISLDQLNDKRWKIDFIKLRDERGSVEFEEALRQVVELGALRPAQEQRIRRTATSVAGGYQACNGHDLVFALAAVLRNDRRVPKRKVETLAELLRVATHPAACAGLTVVRRMARWQEQTGRLLIANR